MVRIMRQSVPPGHRRVQGPRAHSRRAGRPFEEPGPPDMLSCSLPCRGTPLRGRAIVLTKGAALPPSALSPSLQRVQRSAFSLVNADSRWANGRSQVARDRRRNVMRSTAQCPVLTHARLLTGTRCPTPHRTLPRRHPGLGKPARPRHTEASAAQLPTKLFTALHGRLEQLMEPAGAVITRQPTGPKVLCQRDDRALARCRGNDDAGSD